MHSACTMSGSDIHQSTPLITLCTGWPRDRYFKTLFFPLDHQQKRVINFVLSYLIDFMDQSKIIFRYYKVNSLELDFNMISNVIIRLKVFTFDLVLDKSYFETSSK